MRGCWVRGAVQCCRVAVNGGWCLFSAHDIRLDYSCRCHVSSGHIGRCRRVGTLSRVCLSLVWLYLFVFIVPMVSKVWAAGHGWLVGVRCCRQGCEPQSGLRLHAPFCCAACGGTTTMLSITQLMPTQKNKLERKVLSISCMWCEAVCRMRDG